MCVFSFLEPENFIKKRNNGTERSRTKKNLEASFAKESQIRNEHTYFADAAKEEGFEQIF